ncbi:unnamed protein product [marine sediment metagenome]|uniref:Uncharacterized protein n=1 Tax=marine sediment metagenome TaxID=412755 RepID=X1U6X1_9ZZZZ
MFCLHLYVLARSVTSQSPEQSEGDEAISRKEWNYGKRLPRSAHNDTKNPNF